MECTSEHLTDMGPLVALKDGQGWSLRSMIQFYEKHGYMPVPIGGGSGEDDPPEGDDPEGDDPDDDDPDDPEADPEDDGKGAGKKLVKLPKTQAEFNAVVADRLARQKAKITDGIRKDLTRAQQLETAKNDKNLQRQLDIANEELAELRPLKDVVEHFETSAEKRFRNALKTLPDHIKLMAPEDDAPAVEKEKWLTNKAAPALDAFNKQNKDGDGASRRAKPGNSGRRPANSGDSDKTFDEMVEEARRTGIYRQMI